MSPTPRPADRSGSLLFPTIGVIGKRTDPAVKPTLLAICRQLQALGREVLMDDTHAESGRKAGVPVVSRAELAARCQLVVVAGGDGTLLDAGRSLAAAEVPLLGVNQGRLGFMVDVNPEELAEALSSVLAGEYLRDDRLLLESRILRGDGRETARVLAVNDVVIRNSASIRMLEFETWLGEEFISQHRADGMIVSSPTGSTAYALSGGGPVIHPAVAAIALVPICPHTLSDRPIVVPAEQPVKLVLRGPANSRATATCDGQVNEALAPGDSVLIGRAPYPLRLLHPRRYHYFDVLRDKLHWGRGPARG
ncbi:MAG: NAD(+) kinase [Stagnimonas sp.]|nr:NAD(+) kinase [Stagnimonas sp.]